MDPLTIASGVAALSGLGLAWRMRRRARRAEAEVNTLRSVLLLQPAGRVPLLNQRPWRMAQHGPGQWVNGPGQRVNTPSRPRTGIPRQRRPIDPTPRTEAGGT